MNVALPTRDDVTVLRRRPQSAVLNCYSSSREFLLSLFLLLWIYTEWSLVDYLDIYLD